MVTGRQYRGLLHLVTAYARNDGCWQWRRSVDNHGYANLRWGSTIRKAHRVIYEMLREPIPAGLTTDHLCFNPGCINPWHIELVTPSENSRRMWARWKALGVPRQAAPRPKRRPIRNLDESAVPCRRLQISNLPKPWFEQLRAMSRQTHESIELTAVRALLIGVHELEHGRTVDVPTRTFSFWRKHEASLRALGYSAASRGVA